MLIPFKYKRIGESLFHDLRERILDGDSAVILGPRFGGKRYAMFRLRSGLAEAGISPVIHVRMPHDQITSESQVKCLLREAMKDSGEKVRFPSKKRKDVLSSIDDLYGRIGRPVVLLAGNIDALAYHLGRQFLEEVRDRVQERKLIVVLNGEDNFLDLVYGPKSEFNCANQYVLQGLDEGEFRYRIDRYCSALRIEFADREESLHEMWETTGGSSHLLRMLLWEIVEKRVRTDRELEGRFRVPGVRECIAQMRLPGSVGNDVFKHAGRLVSRDPRCWENLESLIKGKPCPVGAADNAPSFLELAGVVIRDHGHFQFSSPLMADYIRSHYDDRHFGDLYVRNDQWDEAFMRYSRLDPVNTIRPSGTADRISIELTVRALSAGLHSTASTGSSKARYLFANGCRYVLGFSEITFWRKDSSEWTLTEDVPGGTSKKVVLAEIRSLLPTGGRTSPGPVPVPDPWDRWALAAILPTVRPDQQAAVVVSNLGKRINLSRERERLTRVLLDHFLKAYSHTISVERDRQRLERRDLHVEVMDSIFDALGSRILDVGHALAMAARGLRSLGYKRVLFCLVNPEGDRIQGVLDDFDDPGADVARMTDWPLSDPKADLQPYVISSGRPKIVEDAAGEPLANQNVVKRAQMKAITIVPLLNRSGRAIGTLHVERKDGAVTTEDEVEDLVLFGRQLATAIEQSERVNLLQAALDKIPEPVLIADRKLQLRYSNKPAGKLFRLSTGWRDRSDARALKGQHMLPLREYLDTAVRDERRLAKHFESAGQHFDLRGAVMADFIKDWRERIVGGVLHVQDLNYLHRVLEALRLIAEASDTASAMRSIVEAARRLGHVQVRLLLVDESDPDRLVNRLSLEPDGKIIEQQGHNQNIEYPRRRDPGYRTWLCLEKKHPIVSCWNESLPDGARFATPFGLEVFNSNPPKCPNELDKHPGDYWIDFPLVTRLTVFGKLSLACSETLWPEQFEFLKILTEMATGLLDAFRRRELLQVERENLVLKSVANQAMGSAAHSISTRLASLPVMLTRYRRLEKETSALADINDDLLHVIEETFNFIERVKERIVTVDPDFTCFDLIERIERTLSVSLSEGTWRLTSSCKKVEVEADGHLLENALLELVENSRVLASDENKLFVDIDVETNVAQSGDSWIRISYRDKGPGVPAEFKERIFENFFSRRPGRETGTGLGLGFVRRVVEAHGGVIVENGEVNEGAQFIIAFPRYSVEGRQGERPCTDS